MPDVLENLEAAGFTRSYEAGLVFYAKDDTEVYLYDGAAADTRDIDRLRAWYARRGFEGWRLAAKPMIFIETVRWSPLVKATCRMWSVQAHYLAEAEGFWTHREQMIAKEFERAECDMLGEMARDITLGRW